MTPDERHRATEGYLEEAEKHPHAIEAISAEFPAAEVSLYLDVLGLEAERPWSHLAEARRLVEGARRRGRDAQGGTSA